MTAWSHYSLFFFSLPFPHFFPSLPSSFLLLLLQSCAIFQPPALSFSHNHSRCYLMSSLHPGKHRPQTWAISLVAMILPHFTCFAIYTNLSLCVCVFVSFSICLFLLLILQCAGHKCVMSAGMFDLCYLSHKENYRVYRCNQWLGRTVPALHYLCVYV